MIETDFLIKVKTHDWTGRRKSQSTRLSLEEETIKTRYILKNSFIASWHQLHAKLQISKHKIFSVVFQ